MKLKDEKAYYDWKNKNRDGYGGYCFRWAEKIMDYLEKEIEEKKPENPAHYARLRMWKVSSECDTEGGTGFQWGVVKAILFHCWIYGGEMDQPDIIK